MNRMNLCEVCLTIILLAKGCSSQGLIDSFLDFASLNSPTGGISTGQQSGFPPDSAFPPDPGFPPDTGFPLDTGFPSDTGFPPDTGIPPDTGFLPDAGSPTALVPSQPLPSESNSQSAPGTKTQPAVDSGNTAVIKDSGSAMTVDPFPVVNEAAEPTGPDFPFDTNPADTQSNTGGSQKSPLFRFLPSIPTGNKFVDLNTGNTNIFQPSDNWMGEPVGGATLDPITPNFPNDGSIDTALGPIVPSNKVLDPMTSPENNLDKPADNIKVNVDTKPTIKDKILVPPAKDMGANMGGIDNKPITTSTKGSANDIVLGQAVVEIVPLQPDVSPKPSSGPDTGPDSQIPDHWMQLYPAGIDPPTEQRLAKTQASTAPEVSPTNIMLAQAALHTFGRNRDLHIMLREERKMARQQLQLEKKVEQAQVKQEKQQVKLEQQILKKQSGPPGQSRGGPAGQSMNRGQGQNNRLSTGPQGAMIARMVIPPLGRGSSRGRRMAPPCRGNRLRQGLCSPDQLPPGLAKKQDTGGQGHGIGPGAAGGHGVGQGVAAGQGNGQGQGGGQKQKDPKIRQPKELTPVDLSGFSQAELAEQTKTSVPTNVENIPGFGFIDWGQEPLPG